MINLIAFPLAVLTQVVICAVAVWAVWRRK